MGDWVPLPLFSRSPGDGFCGWHIVQERLALLSVTELVAGSLAARESFVQLVPAHLDVAVGTWTVLT